MEAIVDELQEIAAELEALQAQIDRATLEDLPALRERARDLTGRALALITMAGGAGEG